MGSRFDRYVAGQFAHPHGLGGGIVCAVMNRQNRPLYEATLAQLPDDAGRVLDVGCGNGFVMVLWAEAHPGVAVGIDPSAGVVHAARRRHRRLIKQGRVVFAEGAAGATGQPDGSFNAAYSVNTVYFWPDLDDGLAEIERVLRPGGVFVNAVYTPEALAQHSHTQHGYRTYEAGELVAAAKAVGFEAEAVPLGTSRAAFCVRCVKPSVRSVDS